MTTPNRVTLYNYSVPTHIVHLSTSHALPLLEEARKSNQLLTVETCHHYLTISSEDIPLKATEFKCCPPIRDSKNKVITFKKYHASIFSHYDFRKVYGTD